MFRSGPQDIARRAGEANGHCRVLSLDGGGTKGYQTLGVLKEMETALGAPLGQNFRLIYGTSTGACTAAFLGLGAEVDEIVAFYRRHIPAVLRETMPHAKAAALKAFCRKAFGKKDFSAFGTGIGIVATDWRRERPLILKTGSALPGEGCTIARAVRASCSAYPLFSACRIRLPSLGSLELADGSYCANNPVVFAIAEADEALRQPRSSRRVISIGAGTYSIPAYQGMSRLIHLFKGVGLLQKTLGINTETAEQLRRASFPDVAVTRIDDYFGGHGLAVDFTEADELKLAQLYQCGRRSFFRHENDLRSMLD